MVDIEQFEHFPKTRYMGSKTKLIEEIGKILDDPKRNIQFESVLDAFAGSTVVSYYFKSKGKKVVSNDFLNFSYHYANAIIENSSKKITDDELDFIINSNSTSWDFVQTKFDGLYFTKEENRLIDKVRENIESLPDKKRSIGIAALSRACLKKRPRGIFTFTGHRYNDGRKDLHKTLIDHFIENIQIFNNAIFGNGKRNKALNQDVYTINVKTDLVYFDPPYCTPNSDNDYIRRYHFIEGLAKYWENIEIQEHTTTKKFKRYQSLFDSKNTIYEAFDQLFAKFKNSIIVVSYSSNSIPGKEEMVELLKKYKSHVEVVEINHTYSFGNQGHKIGNKANRVKEYVFIGK